MANEEWQRQKLLEEAAAPEPARYRDEQDPDAQAVARIMERVELEMQRVQTPEGKAARLAEEGGPVVLSRKAVETLVARCAHAETLRRVALEVAGEIEALTRYGPPDELTAEIAATAARLREAAGEK